ncbi:endolytic transglycosylase MltG [Helicobacter anseris]|uniref:Endolytic murein transglycosylase n=1 Tax=Helicobacter anseris TaxID=375926 RepID=A0A3D8J9X4_9HELI|nr:endolytic transglycosylase MltG [Helicobacter anseris]RDU74287.1 endolytic transglycosylase MltG [Helicobacter anseris]
MTRKNITRLSIFFDLILLIIFTVIFYFNTTVASEKNIFIPKGSIASIITHLSNNGYDVNRFDRFFLRFIGRPQSGFIDIGNNYLSKIDFLYALTKSKAALRDVTLIPGETMYFFNLLLSENFDLKVEDLQKAFEKYASYQDGVIFADTYKLPMGASADFLMQYLVERSMERHRQLAIKVLGIYDQKQWFRYVSIASIIQKEAANIEEMPIVSAVIYNRIKKGMPLQMDGSLNYGKYSHTKVSAQRIRQDMSEFNTYKNKGIPKNPVGSVSIDAIKAAINPARVDYLFFVKNKNGTHSFSRTYTEHQKNIK